MTVRVNQGAYNITSDNNAADARANRRGELVVVDFWTQLVLDGRVFHIQLGTEDAPINSTAGIDDETVWALADNAIGTTMLPAFAQVSLSGLGAATAPCVMLEVDRAKARYSSGGTAYVAENLRTDRPRASRASAYVGTDITAAVKTAVPGSLEIWRATWFEDAIATGTGAEFKATTWCAKQNIPVAIVDLGSLVLHFGAATADLTGYGCLQWAELDTDDVT